MIRFLRRLIIAWHYAAHPGGTTHKAAAKVRTKAELHAQLRREVVEQQLLRAVAEAIIPSNGVMQ